MLSNAYFLAIFRFGTAENEPAKNCKHFANLLPTSAEVSELLNADPVERAGRLRRGAQGSADAHLGQAVRG